MAEENDNIFPLVNRRTPVMDRLRNNDSSDNTAIKAGRLAGEFIVNDASDMDAEKENISEGFRTGLAEALGVDEALVTKEAGEKFSELVTGLEKADVLGKDVIEQLGLSEGSEEEEEGEPEEGEGEGFLD